MNMSIPTLSVEEVDLLKLVKDVEIGNEFILEKEGKPVAKIVPYPKSTHQKRVPGAIPGIEIADDFDELPEDIAKAFGMIEE